MPRSCSALTCTNRHKRGTGITFHSFPHDPVLRRKWMLAIGRNNWTSSHATLCSEHFEETCFDRTGQTVRLREGSMPTLFLNSAVKRFKIDTKQQKLFYETKSLKIEKQDVDKVVASVCQLQAQRDKIQKREERITCREMEDVDLDDHSYPKRSHPLELDKNLNSPKAHCFICDKIVISGTPLHYLTDTAKVQLCTKLDKIVTKLHIVVKEEEVLCSRCANLLNYIDRIEVELSTLNRSIANCIHAKHIQGLKHENLQSILPCFKESLQGVSAVNSTDTVGNDLHSHDSFHNDTTQGTQKDENYTGRAFHCQICIFRTDCKSVMIYHLRQHLAQTYRCDFCDCSVPENILHCVNHNEKCGNSNFLETEEWDSSPIESENENTTVKEIPEILSTDLVLEQDDTPIVSVCDSKSSKPVDIKIKHSPLYTESVEDMLEELHSTGQVSAFISCNNIIKSKVGDTFEIRSDESKTAACNFSEKTTSIKQELKNTDESEVVVDDIKRTIHCGKQVLLDFKEVKSENPNNCTDAIYVLPTVNDINIVPNTKREKIFS